MTDKTKPKRRWLQFSLRTMLIVVTLFCIWIGFTAKRARDQRQAVEMILDLGGGIGYEHMADGSDPPGPEWLRQFIGDEYFFSVYHVKFSVYSLPEVTDTDLVHLKELTNLKSLDLNNSNITDVGLVYLEGLTSLQTLNLNGTQLTDAGLKHLEGLTNLRSLNLSNTKVTDEGVKKLQQALPNCTIKR